VLEADLEGMSTPSGTRARVTLVESPACHYCHDARAALMEIGVEHSLDVETLDVRSPEGTALMQAHGAAMSPLVLLDGQFVSAGRLPRGKLRTLLAARERVAS
jgi:glutaredoxin